MKSKELNIPYRFMPVSIDIEGAAGLPGRSAGTSLSQEGGDCKDTKKSTPLDRVWQDFCIDVNSDVKIKHAVPRISNEILDKGVRWMPRLKKAMKDAVWRRYASGRCPATYDPAISEWDNPIM